MKFTKVIEIWDTIIYFIYNFFQTILYVIKYFFIYKKIGKNKVLKNKYKGKRCFVVLNGPSIKSHDLSYLKNEYVFCTNYMFMSNELVKEIEPNFYCWADSSIFMRNDCKSILDKLYTTCGNIPYFFSYKYSKKYSKIDKNIFLLYNKFIPTNYKIHMSINGRFSGYNTVAFCCISIAISLGFSEINLLGLDFEPGGFTHFGEHGELTDTSLKSNEKKIVCAEYKQYSQAHFESYYIQKEAKRKNIRIYNLNEKSYIRSFPFKKFEAIFYEK